MSPQNFVNNYDERDLDRTSLEVNNENESEKNDPIIIAQQQELISRSIPSSILEVALTDEVKRKRLQIVRLNQEIMKLKNFISKRKQTYKRKRKEEGAPTRALSAYNIFVQDRFSQLAKENEAALKNPDANAQMKRVPPASLVASTGNQWKEISAAEKERYEELAREDRRRYEAQMAAYHPPAKRRNKKRNKTGYNMFFSAHVLQLKDSEQGVPSERGSVARLVGNAWKELSAEEKEYYEREAEKHNAMELEEDDDNDDDEKSKVNISNDTVQFPPDVGQRNNESSLDSQQKWSNHEQQGIHYNGGNMSNDFLSRHGPYARRNHLPLLRHDSRYGTSPHLSMNQYLLHY